MPKEKFHLSQTVTINRRINRLDTKVIDNTIAKNSKTTIS